MIVHTWAKQQGGLFFLQHFSFWLSHHCEMWLGLYKNHCFFFVRTPHEWESWHQNVTEIWSLDDMSNSKDVIAGPEYTRLQKIIVFVFFLHSNHSYVNSEFTKAGWITLAPLKIDKRDKLLKVNVLLDAEWLFGVTPKETCSKKITSYFIRNQIDDYKAVKKWK